MIEKEFVISEKINLNQKEMPASWYNALCDIPFKLDPPISPITKKVVSFEEMAEIFPPPLLEQENSSSRFIQIPDNVIEALLLFRPTPLVRARNFERILNTPCKIYFKNESVSPSGSHKTNTAIAQAYYNKASGIKRMTTETGAGQWGSALSFACKRFGVELRIFMVRVSFNQKPFRGVFMKLFGADVIPSPSNLTQSGRDALKNNPNSPGSLGIAISEAVEEARSRKDTNYGLGSVLNHVLLHQTIIGLEAKKQFEIVGDYPDYIVGCHGGGSNFGGIFLPFLPEILEGRKIRGVAVEPLSCPTLTKGSYAYDYGDTQGLTPIMKMFTLGHSFIPPEVHAGGLRYHGASPIISALKLNNIIDAVAVGQTEVFKSALLFAETEGIVPAPESAHAIAYIVKKAEECKEEGREKTLLFSLSGHGLFDLSAYEQFLSNTLVDYEFPEVEIQKSLKRLPEV